MVVEEHNVVTIWYELRDGGEKGELLERMDVNYPFTFLFGAGRLLPSFEENLEGLNEKDSFEFTIPAEEAYGPRQEGNVLDLPMHLFEQNEQDTEALVKKGNYVNLKDENGQEHQGQILDFNDEQVTVDFNHVMAGRDLHFKGSILNVRKATVDELVKKHHIPEDGVRGGGNGEDAV